MCFCKAVYPRRRKKFLLTASLAMLLGAMKEIRGAEEPPVSIYLKVKLGELTNFPSLKIFSTAFVSALFFLGNIPVLKF